MFDGRSYNEAPLPAGVPVLLTAAEVCRALRCRPCTLSKLQKQGLFPGTVRVAKRRLFPMEDIQNVITHFREKGSND